MSLVAEDGDLRWFGIVGWRSDRGENDRIWKGLGEGGLVEEWESG